VRETRDVEIAKPYESRSSVALITGGGSGIGRATALAFAERGYSVVVAGRREEPLSEVVNIIHTRGGTALAVKCDVSSEGDVYQLLERTTQEFGRVDAAVNCAALQPGSAILESSVEDFDRTIATNLRGAWLTTRFAAFAMRESGGGVIVNVSSVSAMRGGPSDYSASKAGVEGLTRGAAEELAPWGIRVVALRAGLFDTPMLHRAWGTGEHPEEVLAPGVGATILKRIGRPEEAATAILWLCSPDASYITGTCIDVDGGIMAHWL
jgi:NAD(P)-dependent dehydrogenase (short-subunit alcohol dehydrogenase family)